MKIKVKTSAGTIVFDNVLPGMDISGTIVQEGIKDVGVNIITHTHAEPNVERSSWCSSTGTSYTQSTPDNRVTIHCSIDYGKAHVGLLAQEYPIDVKKVKFVDETTITLG